ncbi:hypothetical protein EELLY_v1c03620 [Entomoplasma ellychniae]|uniref:ASCH domain-containing protein n=1 Tax=Entomoplasma ellychniae TaxID=2114 RepID=A0A8E2UCS1_9MOLU|nr:hypothetical protein [Entomoplasma ellychniae]PPE04357.1 hypothetical protein EELLY_v1c00310 [Entomoplasma ellychniae]PPE04611.1 hypothetical protein EELLY_v1c02910 [Entomoplasma ellychniae]PPE04682.1 hypothetical protein EELLY_v1c03620 [Entomoplasma ellychniae]
MKNIILPINPTYSKKIINKTKLFEYRTRMPSTKIKYIYIYATKPICKIIAKVEVIELISFTPNELWKITKNESGITKEYFDNYFKGKNIAHAYRLGNIHKFLKPKNLKEFGINFIPQSFVYTDY